MRRMTSATAALVVVTAMAVPALAQQDGPLHQLLTSADGDQPADPVDCPPADDGATETGDETAPATADETGDDGCEVGDDGAVETGDETDTDETHETEDIDEVEEVEEVDGDDGHGEIVSTVARCAPRGSGLEAYLDGPANHGGFVRAAAHGDSLEVDGVAYDLSTLDGAEALCAALADVPSPAERAADRRAEREAARAERKAAKEADEADASTTADEGDLDVTSTDRADAREERGQAKGQAGTSGSGRGKPDHAGTGNGRGRG